MKDKKDEEQKLNAPDKKLSARMKVGIICFGAASFSLLMVLLTSTNSIFFSLFFVCVTLAIIITPISTTGNVKRGKSNMSRWVRGDSIDPSNPFNSDRR